MEARPRILVVDDDGSTRQLLVDLFSPLYAVAEEENALNALEDLDAGHYDLLILDLDLPGLSGEEALARLRYQPHGRDLPVLVMSAYGGMRERLRTSAVRVDAVVPKPFELVEMEQTVERLCRGRHAAA